MSIELISPKLNFREVTYKLKKEKLENDGPIPAKTTINFGDASINPIGDKFVFVVHIKVILDTDDMFFEANCIFRAQITGITASLLEGEPNYFTEKKGEIENQAVELMRLEVNNKINSFLSMTVTAPAKKAEFWPVVEQKANDQLADSSES